MDAWTVYWLFKLDDIQTLFQVASFILVIGAMVSTVGYFISRSYYDKQDKKTCLKFMRPLIPVAITCLVVAVLIPSTKTMAAIIVLPKIVSAENLDMVAKDGGDIYKLAMERIKDTLGQVQADKP